MKTLIYLTKQQQKTLENWKIFIHAYKENRKNLTEKLLNKEYSDSLFAGYGAHEIEHETTKYIDKLLILEDEYKQVIIIADQFEPILNKHRVAGILEKKDVELFSSKFVEAVDDATRSLGGILYNEVKPEVTKKGIKEKYTRGLPFFKETMEYLATKGLCSQGSLITSYKFNENVTVEAINQALIEFYTQRLCSMTLLQLIKEASSQEGLTEAQGLEGGERNQIIDDFLVGKNTFITALKKNEQIYAYFQIVSNAFVIVTQLDQMVNSLGGKKDELSKFIYMQTRFLMTEIYRPMMNMIKEFFQLEQLIFKIQKLQIEKNGAPDKANFFSSMKSDFKNLSSSSSREDRHALKFNMLNSLVKLLQFYQKQMLLKMSEIELKKIHLDIKALIERFGKDYLMEFSSDRLIGICKDNRFDYEQYEFKSHPRYNLIAIASDLINRLNEVLEQSLTESPPPQSGMVKTLFFSKPFNIVTEEVKNGIEALKSSLTKCREAMEVEVSDEPETWRTYEKTLFELADTKVGHKNLDADMGTAGSLRHIATQDRQMSLHSHHLTRQ